MTREQKELLKRLDQFTQRTDRISDKEQEEIEDMVLEAWVFAPDRAAAAEHAFSQMALVGLIEGY